MPRAPIVAALALLAAFALAASPAGASELASLHASFSPDRLATPTTISFSFHLSTPQGTAPPPLQSIDLQMPAGLNYTTTTLGRALSIELCSPEDVAAGRRLLELAPEEVRQSIRKAGYRPNQYTHEVIANVYALLMTRRRRNVLERPEWLNEEIYGLVVSVTGWTE